MLLLCVFACLVEILVAIVMSIMCLMLLLILVLGESWCSIAIYIGLLANTMMILSSYLAFMLVICHVHYSCLLFFTHDMIAMIPPSTLHLRTTSLLDLITMIACFVACIAHVPFLLAFLG